MSKRRRRNRAVRPLLTLLALNAATLAVASPAHAAFPGANGKIGFGDGGIKTINPDGTGETAITAGCDGRPAWSADGQKIVFARSDCTSPSMREIWTMNADGSGQTKLTNAIADYFEQPTWSPDGTKIVFTKSGNLWTMNADGSDQTDTGQAGSEPAWSPNGQRIAFSRLNTWQYGTWSAIYTMNPDGTGVTLVRDPSDHCVQGENCQYDYDPRWSPDGQKIAFLEDDFFSFGTFLGVINANGTNVKFIALGVSFGGSVAWSPDGRRIAAILDTNDPAFGILTMNADGTDQAQIRPDSGVPGLDWQPLPTASYPHPQSASQLQVALVPAFRQCGTGGNPSNASHSPPVATGSCDPPRPGSVLAAVGTASQSSAQMTVVAGDSDPTNGNQANVSLAVGMTDIQAVSGGDYLPNPSGSDMTAVTRLRFTDKANGYGGLPATATEYDFRVPIDCASTSDPSVGSSCSASTTANALVPGLVQEQRQTIVQAFRVRVDDAGNNGVPGDSDDRIFATQGVFVP